MDFLKGAVEHLDGEPTATTQPQDEVDCILLRDCSLVFVRFPSRM